MKPAYIVSAYKRPDLLIRLVRLLEGHPVAIHVDRKSDIFEEVQAALGSLPNITLLPRHVCHWGLFGHVRASLEGMKWFLGTSCDYAILLTGQCYPLKPQSEIERDLEDLGGRSVINFAAFPKAEWQIDAGGYRRLDQFYFRARAKRGDSRYLRLNRFYLRIGSEVRFLRIKLWTRKPPLGLRPYGGSGYWCLSRNCVQYVIAFVRAHPEVKRFFSTTFVPDEMFFHTILANSPHRAELIDSAIHYIDWSGAGANPAVITAGSLPAAMASGAWFSRKFEDPAVLDLVDDLRMHNDQSFPTSPWRKKA